MVTVLRSFSASIMFALVNTAATSCSCRTSGDGTRKSSELKQRSASVFQSEERRDSLIDLSARLGSFQQGAVVSSSVPWPPGDADAREA